MIISSIVCIVYCNHLSSSYDETSKIKVIPESEDVKFSEEEQDDLAIHAMLEE